MEYIIWLIAGPDPRVPLHVYLVGVPRLMLRRTRQNRRGCDREVGEALNCGPVRRNGDSRALVLRDRRIDLLRVHVQLFERLLGLPGIEFSIAHQP